MIYKWGGVIIKRLKNITNFAVNVPKLVTFSSLLFLECNQIATKILAFAA